MFLHTDFWNSLSDRLKLLREKDQSPVQPMQIDNHVSGEESLIDLFPDEIMLLIFSWLDSRSACTCRLVSKKWKVLTTDDHLWKLYLSYEKPLNKRWSFLHLPSDHKNLNAVFATGAFNYNLSICNSRHTFITHRDSNKKLYQDVSCVSTNFGSDATDELIAEALIPEERYLNNLQVLRLRPRKYNPSTLYLALNQIGRHCPEFRELIATGSNLDDNALMLIEKFIETIQTLHVKNTSVTANGVNKLISKKRKLKLIM